MSEPRKSIVGGDLPEEDGRRKTLAGVDSPLRETNDQVVVIPDDTKKLDEIEAELEAKAEAETEDEPRAYQRYYEDEPLPKYTVCDFCGARTMKVLKVLFVLLVIAYTIAVLVLDFHRGLPILFIEIAFFSLVLLWFIISRSSKMLERGRQRLDRMPRWAAVSLQLLLLVIAVAISFALSRDDFTRMYALAGLVVIILLCYVLSWNRRAVNWRPVIWGFALQFLLALFILRTEQGNNTFKFLGDQVSALLAYTGSGVDFVFGPLLALGPFALTVLPVIIFFSGITSLLFYLGVLQVFTLAVGNIMIYTMGTSAPESFSTAGNIFLGQTEAPLLIRPYLKYMTASELHAVMTGGFATIAGSVLAAYISFGFSPTHLLSASVMSAPAALAISKLIYPETIKVDDSHIDKLDIGEQATNAIEAFTRGATLSAGLLANIIVNLIAFLALIQLLNAVTVYILVKLGIFGVDFTTLVGYIFSPFALLMGISATDVEVAGKVLGLKIIANEFVAYADLTAEPSIEHGGKTFIILTYALCGFSNLSSIGIQLGGLGGMAPTKLKVMSKIAVSACLAGNIACFMTACIAGVLLKQ